MELRYAVARLQDTMTLRTSLLTLGALVACIAAVACSGKSSDPTPTPAPSATNTATAPAATPTTAPATPTQPLPTATPVPPTPTATPEPPIAAPAGVYEHGDRDSNLVALTFDMGGRVEPALDIMNWLIANGIRATIFMTGSMVENVNTDAGREVLRLIEQHADQFDLGNHSYSHPDFRDLTEAEMAGEIGTTDAAIAEFTAKDPRPLFRPPFGGQDARVATGVAAMGYSHVIMWDIDTIDWRPEADGGPTAAEIETKVVTGAQGGTIVLMHLGGFNTFEALPGMVEGLRDRGFQFATVSEMLGLGE